MHLICHVKLQDHMIKQSCDFMGAKSSLYVTTLPSLVAIGIVVVEMFLSHDLARSRDSNVL